MRGTLKYNAWRGEAGTVYTLAETPAVGDAVFSAPNTDSGKKVEEAGFGYIAFGFGLPHYERDNTLDAIVQKYRPIVTPLEMMELTRLEYSDQDKLVPLIREAELHVKATIGDELYIRIVTNPPDPAFDDLLEGCVYRTTCGDRSFEGLKTAVAYYAYAKVCKSDIVPTRYCNADKRSEYSYHSTLTERQKNVREALEYADKHLQDCLDYIFTATDWICPCRKPKVRLVSSHSLRFRIIDGEDKPRGCRNCKPVKEEEHGGGDDEHTSFNNDFNNDFD
jgi:hypothetical protein